jgi:hypothetical protein
MGAGHLPGYCPGIVPGPEYPGRIFWKYPAPPFLAKDWKKSFSGIGPDIWPDNVTVLFRGPDYPGGGGLSGPYLGRNIRPPEAATAQF